jgi:hypothetical protein
MAALASSVGGVGAKEGHFHEGSDLSKSLNENTEYLKRGNVTDFV